MKEKEPYSQVFKRTDDQLELDLRPDLRNPRGRLGRSGSMDINRNQVFLAGIVLLFLGTEFRMMDSFVLNAKVTKLLAEQTNHPVATAGNTMGALVGWRRPFRTKLCRSPSGWAGSASPSVRSLFSRA